MAPIKIAFLGAGHSHAFEKLKVVRENPAWELVGVCDEDSAVRTACEKEGIRMLSRADIVGDFDVKVVAVESAVKDHAFHARMAIDAHKHIHLEKPPADTYEDFQSLVMLAARYGVRMQMGYMWRYHPGINAALEAARQGWLGDVYLVRGTMNTLIGADRRPEWAQFRGGQMFEQGCHLIDPMVRLLGKPQKVTPFLRRHGAFDDDLADNTAAVFEYPRALGIVMSSVLQPGAGRHRSFEVFGSNGNAVVRPIEPPVLEIDLDKPAGPYKTGPQKVPLPAFRRYVGDFVELADSVANGPPLKITPREDLLVHAALIQASAM
jgi:predicted dehydrogenase